MGSCVSNCTRTSASNNNHIGLSSHQKSKKKIKQKDLSKLKMAYKVESLQNQDTSIIMTPGETKPAESEESADKVKRICHTDNPM